MFSTPGFGWAVSQWRETAYEVPRSSHGNGIRYYWRRALSARVQHGANRHYLGAEEPLPPEDRKIAIVSGATIERLYRIRAPSLIRYFSRWASREDAADLAQESFARLVRIDGASDEVVRPEAYLSSIARNLLRDRSKTRRRHSADQHFPLNEVDLLAPDQERALEARDMLNRIEQAMLGLPLRAREIFLAHRIDGYSYAEISVRTGMSVRIIEREMSRAIAHLDRVMSER